jgi:hypothetical protein
MSPHRQSGKGRRATTPSGPPARSRGDGWFLFGLLALAGLAALLWFGDPSHSWTDSSRILWPGTTPPKR